MIFLKPINAKKGKPLGGTYVIINNFTDAEELGTENKNKYYYSFDYSLAETPGKSLLLLKMNINTLIEVLECFSSQTCIRTLLGHLLIERDREDGRVESFQLCVVSKDCL